VIQQANGNPSRALLSGGVTLQQEMDDGDRIDAAAANVDYDMKNETMVFTGNVVIKQSRGSINGERVVYNLKSGQLQSGGEGGGRVKMRILPKDTAAPAAPSSAKGTP
jgi:lipopolysaccharide export system protein LptA